MDDRQKEIIEALTKTLEENPHQRIGQLIYNALYKSGIDLKQKDIFFVKDNDFLNALIE